MPHQCHTYRNTFLVAAGVVAIAACWTGRADADEFVLARDGQPVATIVTAAVPTDAAAFAAQELQYHVQKITGATLPIKSDADKVEGTTILVGPSAATAQMGVDVSQFKDQEYLIRFVDNRLILLGKDTPSRTNVEKAKDWPAPTGVRLPPPPPFDDQATSYAAHDFLERFCNVRWFGPGELGMVLPKTATLAVQSKDVRRGPAFAYRQPGGWALDMIANQWNKPSPQDVGLFWARLRVGGEPYSCNHSLNGYYDRFWKKNLQALERFVAEHLDWFATDYADANGKPRQMCFSSQGLVDQVVADARAFYDDQRAEPGAATKGQYFGVAAMDAGWCKCPACQAQIDQVREKKRDDGGLFSIGAASEYWFTFVNKVAREVGKTHPDKYIATLAYADYAYCPRGVKLEPNISVQPCLQVRNYWAPGIRENDLQLCQDWITREKGRRLFTWLYYCFPELLTGGGKWHCFPGFNAHNLDTQLKMYARDGIRGVFLNNYGEQVDLYVTLKLWDDPSLDIDALLDDFFTRCYGAASTPLKQFYLQVEDIFSSTTNYPEDVQKNRNKNFHQTEEIAWKYLGTEERMDELGKLMENATRLASTEVEKQRVGIFRGAVWDYMVEGRAKYLAKQTTTNN